MPRTLRLLALLVFCTLAACSSDAPAPDISLVDQHGERWTLSAQRGAPLAVYFGYTHCLDTCPTMLAKLTKSLANVPDAKVVFVTVDPERDTPRVLDAYAKRFTGAPIVALTGTQGEVSAAENAYHVWAQKIPGKRGNDNYDDAHASYAFLIDSDGVQRALFHDDDSMTTIADAVEKMTQ